MKVQDQSQSACDPDGCCSGGILALEALDGVPLALVIVDQNLRIAYRNAAARTMLADVDALDVALRGAEFLGHFDGWSREIAGVIASGEVRRFSCGLPSNSKPRSVLLLRGSMSRLSATRKTNPASQTGQTDARVAIWLEPRDSAETSAEQVEITHRLASLGKLAARVAHELNNPLDGIQRYINLALRTLDESTEPKVASYLSESRTGIKRMAQIIGDLLEFSRSTEGEFDDVPINDVIEQAIRAHAKLAADHKVIVAADFQTVEMPSIRGGRLFQVLSNLIKNALDAMPEGGRLTLTSAVVSQEVILRVTDTGPGLAHAPEEVFEAFLRQKKLARGPVSGWRSAATLSKTWAGRSSRPRLPAEPCLRCGCRSKSAYPHLPSVKPARWRTTWSPTYDKRNQAGSPRSRRG